MFTYEDDHRARKRKWDMVLLAMKLLCSVSKFVWGGIIGLDFLIDNSMAEWRTRVSVCHQRKNCERENRGASYCGSKLLYFKRLNQLWTDIRATLAVFQRGFFYFAFQFCSDKKGTAKPNLIAICKCPYKRPSWLLQISLANAFYTHTHKAKRLKFHINSSKSLEACNYVCECECIYIHTVYNNGMTWQVPNFSEKIFHVICAC